MQSFQTLWDIAASRHGGDSALEKKLPKVKSRRSLLRVGDDRFLAGFTKQVFCAGFVWSVVEAKWEHFEAAFEGFEPARVAVMKDRALDALAKDPSIVRHRAKIEAVRDNAEFVMERAEQHGSFARFIADWPAQDFVGLLDELKREGARLGGSTGAYALRALGVDGLIPTGDVVRRLKLEGVLAKAPTSKRDRRAMQEAFNTWHEESGRGLAAISKVLALSVE